MDRTLLDPTSTVAVVTFSFCATVAAAVTPSVAAAVVAAVTPSFRAAVADFVAPGFPAGLAAAVSADFEAELRRKYPPSTCVPLEAFVSKRVAAAAHSPPQEQGRRTLDTLA